MTSLVSEKECVLIKHSSAECADESKKRGFLEYFKKLSTNLDKLGVEINGIERIPSDSRSHNKWKQMLTVTGLWLSGCGGLTSMSSFYLGPMVYGLGLQKTLISGILGQFMGCLVAAYYSLMGPRSGCRQLVTARILFGWWSVKAIAVISVIGGVGWSVVNCIAGGQILNSVSDGKVPLVVSIVIIAIASLCVSVVGIRFLLKAEAFLAIPVMVASLLLYVVSADKYKYLSLEDSPGFSFSTVKANSLSFFSLCYSITSTWGAVASDYYILFPENTPDIQVFTLTFLGILVPTTFVGVIAILTGNIVMNYAPWTQAFDSLSMGGILGAAFEPWKGGGKFLLVIMFISLICNNVMNTYSAGLSIQLVGVTFGRVPRWFWSSTMAIIYLVLAIAGRYKFATILGNFLPMIGYWVSSYFFILLEEDTIFRTSQFRHLYAKESENTESDDSSLTPAFKTNYNFLIWNNRSKLTNGFAATFAFLCGAAGAAVGMSQTYWIGPLAKKVGGDFGGDIALWLCMGFSGVVYPGLRYWELKRYGK